MHFLFLVVKSFPLVGVLSAFIHQLEKYSNHSEVVEGEEANIFTRLHSSHQEMSWLLMERH